ncbi:REP-associated tyrosine transposase [Candidatus Nitrotoga sp. 1052]|uniref:REP-associated tyrosine transposase n=1 Tax=Candidatus Nitrotoga sp. 1052 TaxID=2886964 RepID=UPI001F9D9031|nr:transposase [Candidatus Nitrotoga sp. 1052]
MSRYRRAMAVGSSYFFTVVAYRRQSILCDEAIRNALRASIETVRVARPFVIDAWELLPDHLHCVWTLPDGDADFSTRWMMIKRAVSLACREDYRRADWVTASKLKHRESTIWQRRFWEHQIRDENDFAAMSITFISIRLNADMYNVRLIGLIRHFTAMCVMGYMRMTGLLRWKAARVGTKTCPPYLTGARVTAVWFHLG